MFCLLFEMIRTTGGFPVAYNGRIYAVHAHGGKVRLIKEKAWCNIYYFRGRKRPAIDCYSHSDLQQAYRTPPLTSQQNAKAYTPPHSIEEPWGGGSFL